MTTYDNATIKPDFTSAANHLGASHVIGSGSNRIVWLVISWSGANTITAMKWGGAGGADMTKIGATFDWGAGPYHMALYKLANPDSGSAQPYVAWSDLTIPQSMSVLSQSGVDQSTPNGTVATAQASGASEYSNPYHDFNVDVASVADDVVVGFAYGLCVNPNTVAPSIAPNGGETERVDFNESTAPMADAINIEEEVATTTTTNLAWRVTHDAGNYYLDYGVMAFAVKASTAPAITSVNVDRGRTFGRGIMRGMMKLASGILVPEYLSKGAH